MTDIGCSREAAEDYFAFLDDLRASGAVNMFGARPHLMEEFGLDGKLASSVVSAWMKTFDPKASVADRAASACETVRG